jgi:hypothetical protein
MKFSFQSVGLRLAALGRATLQAITSGLAALKQFELRSALLQLLQRLPLTRLRSIDRQLLQSRLAALKPLNYQSVALRMTAFGLVALFAVLLFGGIQAIARGDDPAPGTLHPSVNLAQNQFPQAASSGLSERANQLWERFNRTRQMNQPTRLQVSTAAPTITPPAVSGANPFPPQMVAAADPSNYGDRYATDVYGNPVHNDWLIVLHETVGPADSAIALFQTRHPRDEDQVSYHTLIRRDGTVIYVVPPEKRAFGAGDSAFNGPNGVETVRTNLEFPPSVNNFAYHISLESPPDGYGGGTQHSGYTEAQYQALAWLIAGTNVPDGRISTHRLVDRSGTRIDPRSFSDQEFFALLHRYPTRAAMLSGNGQG